MVNIYDQVHSLAKVLQESEEYKQYISTKKELDQHQEQKKLLFDFKRQQFELQTEQFAGKQVDEEKLKGLQSFYSTLMLNPVIANFMHAELKFTQMMSDVYKIINDAVEIDLDFMKE